MDQVLHKIKLCVEVAEQKIIMRHLLTYLLCMSTGPPVADLRDGAAEQYPGLGQRRLDGQGVGHHLRRLSADTLR